MIEEPNDRALAAWIHDKLFQSNGLVGELILGRKIPLLYTPPSWLSFDPSDPSDNPWAEIRQHTWWAKATRYRQEHNTWFEVEATRESDGKTLNIGRITL